MICRVRETVRTLPSAPAIISARYVDCSKFLGREQVAGSLTRRLAVAAIPDSLLRGVKRAYYVRLLRTMCADPDTAACRKYIGPGDVVLDIGAHVGTYTKFFAEYVGPDGHVFAVEPVPETFGYLVNSIKKLRLDNVSCHNVAAYSFTRSGCMTVPTWGDGTQNLYQAHISENGIPVRMSSLDDLFPDLHPSFIKCDVERAEIEVIKGAARLIASCRPVWLIEVSHKEVFELMYSYGYEAIHGHVRSNWFFSP